MVKHKITKIDRKINFILDTAEIFEYKISSAKEYIHHTISNEIYPITSQMLEYFV